jgi:penicillin-binding protein 1C
MEIKDINESGDYYGPSLALGSADVSLWELTNAYRTLANNGQWSEITLTLDKLRAKNTRTIFSPAAAFIVSDILADREARSSTFGLENSLATKYWSAVKTGTSKDMRDNWCVGYSSRYTVGVWVGNYSGESMWNVSGVSGAAPVWYEIMNYLHRHKAGHKMAAPSTVVKKEFMSSLNIGKPQDEWFIKGTEPSSMVQIVKQYNEKIVYPPSGTIIALDPDIPQDLQKVFFIARTEDKELKWRLNKSEIEEKGKTIAWSPRIGKYNLELTDMQSKIIDSVSFEVRGAEQFDSDDSNQVQH